MEIFQIKLHHQMICGPRLDCFEPVLCGIGLGRNFTARYDRKDANCLRLSVVHGLNQPKTVLVRSKLPCLARQRITMSTQPNQVPRSEQVHSDREAPVSEKCAARFLNLHPKTVLRKAREGSLPAHPVGTDRKRWHFYLSELDQWLRSQVISASHPRRQPQGDYIG